jgi:hypothetical protein
MDKTFTLGPLWFVAQLIENDGDNMNGQDWKWFGGSIALLIIIIGILLIISRLNSH